MFARQTIYFGAISQLKLIYYVHTNMKKKENESYLDVSMRHGKNCTFAHTHTVYPFTTTASYSPALSCIFLTLCSIHIERKRKRETHWTLLWNTRIHDIVSWTGWLRAELIWSGLKTRNKLIYIDGGFLFDMRSLYFTIKLSTHRWDKHTHQSMVSFRIVFAQADQMCCTLQMHACVCMRVRTSKKTRQKERSREPKVT